MSVFTKLMTARITLQSMEMKKTGKNKFAGYNYFELSDFLPATLKIFYDLGICGVVSYETDRATLSIYDCEKPEEVIVFQSPMSTAALKGAHEIQNLGAVQTYLRRYLWVAAMEIVEHDALDAVLGNDAGGSTPRRREAVTERRAAASEERRERQAPAQSAESAENGTQAASTASRLMAKLVGLGITKYGIKTILAITEAEEFEKIAENKASTLLSAITGSHVKMFNQGKNSKGVQIIPAPEVDTLSARNSIDELAAASEELFSEEPDSLDS